MLIFLISILMISKQFNGKKCYSPYKPTPTSTEHFRSKKNINNQPGTILSRNKSILDKLSAFKQKIHLSKSIARLFKPKDTFQITMINQSKEGLENAVDMNSISNENKTVRSGSFVSRNKKEKMGKEMSDEFIYNSVFYKVNKDKLVPIDNRYNLIYSENPKQFEVNYERTQRTFHSFKKNKKLSKRALYIEDKINEIHGKVFFIKGVTNFVYPNILASKLKEKTKNLYRCVRSNLKSDLTPCELNDKLASERNRRMTDFLTQTITVVNRSKSVASFKLKKLA